MDFFLFLIRWGKSLIESVEFDVTWFAESQKSVSFDKVRVHLLNQRTLLSLFRKTMSKTQSQLF
jgi:hypothetical protein